MTPKTNLRTKTLYVFGESATRDLEKATTEIRQGVYMKPFSAAGKIDFSGRVDNQKIHILKKGFGSMKVSSY
jgi:hypothetical protein